MSQQNLSQVALPTYIHGLNFQSHDWYVEHMPHSKTLMDEYWIGFNLSRLDFQRLQDELAASRGPDAQNLKTIEGRRSWQNWASEFCGDRFGELDRGWLIEAVIWLKKKHIANIKKRKITMEPKSAPELSPRETARPRVIWVAATPIASGSQPMDIEKNLVVRFLKTTNELHQDTTMPWFDSTDLDDFSRLLGPAFVQSINPTQLPDIHQGLVLMQIVKHICNVDVSVCAWDDFYKKFVEATELETMKSMLLDEEQKPRSTIILLSCDSAICLKSGMDLLYNRLERLRSCLGARIVPIPSWTEALRARGRIADLQALDEQARKRGTWRPNTCYPYGDCTLLDADYTVHKRQESSGGEHVKTRRRDDDGDLTCSKNGISRTKKGTQGRKKSSRPTESKPLWLHQELVPTFKDWGEFRVVFVMKPDKKHRRGLKPTVVSIAHTVDSTTDAETMHGELATEATFEKIDCGLSLAGLRSFSTTVINDLLDDYEETFQSLKVGGRLDVAISPYSPRSFFVNEVTRWYEAAFFSDILAEPKYTLCEEFAKAFVMYLSKIRLLGSP
ncbi:hypothetical protein BKA64DRAFT_655007 [Cadophora sp. MPI-SDFR-AT-0126]|nr:hypothetical protein BKA64DRAFT_655007 [Leotiomycetes sp. MPI-SDFR-AT-0126]